MFFVFEFNFHSQVPLSTQKQFTPSKVELISNLSIQFLLCMDLCISFKMNRIESGNQVSFLNRFFLQSFSIFPFLFRLNFHFFRFFFRFFSFLFFFFFGGLFFATPRRHPTKTFFLNKKSRDKRPYSKNSKKSFFFFFFFFWFKLKWPNISSFSNHSLFLFVIFLSFVFFLSFLLSFHPISLSFTISILTKV